MAILNKSHRNNSLHRRITQMLFAVAVVTTAIYLVYVVTMIDKLEDAMIYTLVGHEIDEVVTDLAQDPNIKLPKTASVNAYLLSREAEKPIPEYLKKLEPTLHRNLKVGEKTVTASILDLGNDRLYLTFDITSVRMYRSKLQVMLIAGGVFSMLVLVILSIWLSRKFLNPVSQIAEDLNAISPETRNVRIRDKYQGYEVGKIAESVDNYLAKLDEYVENEQSFTDAVSHELRTPVAIIASAVDLLELKGIHANQKDAFNRIKTSTVSMGKVIESLLIFVRKNPTAYEESIPEIELYPIFETVVTQYRGSAQIKNNRLTLELEAISKFRMVEKHAEIMLGNLVRNAIEHTVEGEIVVRLMSTGFSVRDTGRGIHSSDIDSILQLRYFGSSSRGFGVGLYLVMNICKYYGLELKINSQPGQGAEFLVIFPNYQISSISCDRSKAG